MYAIPDFTRYYANSIVVNNSLQPFLFHSMIVNTKCDSNQEIHNLTQSNYKLFKTKIELVFDFIIKFIIAITL